MKPIRCFMIAILFILLAGCSSNHIVSTFDYLSGYKYWTVQAAAGQTLHVAYKAVLTKGSLVLQVTSPQRKLLWTVKGDSNGTQTKDILITVKGGYTISVRADAAYGSYDIQYAIKKPTTPTP
jgi:hypothetical protein